MTLLNLSSNELRDDGIVRLTEALKGNTTLQTTLQHLNLDNNVGLTCVSYRALEQLLICHNFTLDHLMLPILFEVECLISPYHPSSN